MKKLISLWGFALLMLGLCSNVWADTKYLFNTGFRHIPWGATKDEVKKKESERGLKFLDEEERLLEYEGEYFGEECKIIYCFSKEEKLERGYYGFKNKDIKPEFVSYVKSIFDRTFGVAEEDSYDWQFFDTKINVSYAQDAYLGEATLLISFYKKGEEGK